MSEVADFLLEFLSEEIPARMQARARGDLARMFAEMLSEVGLSHEGITVHSTPRRLALIAQSVPHETAARSEEFKGPRTSAPQAALEGFLRKNKLSQDQLEDRDGVWFANVEKPGKKTAEIFAARIPLLIWQFQWAKTMRWGDASKSTASLRWVRPLHGIVAIHGTEIVPFSLDMAHFWENTEGQTAVTFESIGIRSGAATLGHRFHHPGQITIGGAHDYVEKLRACHVLVDHEEREAIIRDGARSLADDAGYLLVADEGLVVENAGLTEWPVPLFGSFDPGFLDVPEEVIQLTARINQKYFVMREPGGKLAPHFICIANIDANDGGEAITAGNERVLAARLSDARFFWQQDMKVPLEEQAKKLEQIVFHEKLGTVADKAERMASLAEWLAKVGIVSNCDSKLARRAAELCKADLVTGMVGEFPELQGIIGGYLAREGPEPELDAIADAIRDHYKPVGQGDEVPTAPVTVAVSLADKLDSLGAFFGEKMFPTGSKDPFALRRAALGTIALIRANKLQLDIGEIIRQGWGAPSGLIGDTLIDFLIERLKIALKDEGIRHDLIAASTDWHRKFDGRLDRVERRATALQAFVETGEGVNLLAGYKRAANILKKEQWDAGAASVADVLDDEATLAAAVELAEGQAEAAVAEEDFTAAMAALASLRAPIDAFFDTVTVNAPDGGVRVRRLNLLARFRDAVHKVADFSKIEG